MSRRIPWARIAVVLVTAVAILMPLAIVGYQSLLDGPFFQPSARLSLSAFRFVLADPDFKGAKLRARGVLADVAPTALQVMGLPQPKEMKGLGLILR